MKNLIIIGLLAFVFATPLGARAQTATPVTNEQLLEIIQSLMQQVLSLMEQLKKIEATQTASSQAVQATQVQLPVQQNFGAVSQPSLSATIGTPFCDKSDKSNFDTGEPTLPITFEGRWEYGLVRIQPSVKNTIGGRAFQNRQNSPYLFGVRDNWGTTTVVISLDPNQFIFPNHEVPAKFSTTQTIYIGDVCQ